MGEKQTEYAEGVEITISAIEVETNPQNPRLVNRFRFKTDKGDITFRPKVERNEYQAGMKIITQGQMGLDEIPESILRVSTTISEKGHIRMKASYTVMTDEVDGEKKTYRFITSQKTFDKWEILPEVTKEERIE